MSVPATARDGAYFCELPVEEGTRLLTLVVSRPDGDRLRVTPMRAISVGHGGLPIREAFRSFALEDAGEGAVRMKAAVPDALANLGVPTLGPLHGSNSTHAWVQLHFWPVGDTLHAGHGVTADWAGPREIDTRFDVREAILAIERDGGRDHGEDDFFLMAYAFARNDAAYAISESLFLEVGECRKRVCYVIDA